MACTYRALNYLPWRSKARYSPIHPCTYIHPLMPNMCQPITTRSNLGLSVLPKHTLIHGWAKYLQYFNLRLTALPDDNDERPAHSRGWRRKAWSPLSLTWILQVYWSDGMTKLNILQKMFNSLALCSENVSLCQFPRFAGFGPITEWAQSNFLSSKCHPCFVTLQVMYLNLLRPGITLQIRFPLYFILITLITWGPVTRKLKKSISNKSSGLERLKVWSWDLFVLLICLHQTPL